ncbi:MAG: LysR family transcriptional regulator [Pseudomonadota bacterium]
MHNWDEIRTAFHVAKQGTVSGAADVLGVHHATVIRHIDALEARLGIKLFQRHPRGYAPTEAGQDLLQVAQATEDQFSQLESRMKGKGETVEGDLVVTTLSSLATALMPVLLEFQHSYPKIQLRLVTSSRVLRLEYGEAHVALRAGPAPSEPDNIVRKLTDLSFGLYAAQPYADRWGLPTGPDDYKNHRFVGFEGRTGDPSIRWMNDNIPKQNIVFRSTDTLVNRQAITSGLGIGFLSQDAAAYNADLIPLPPPDIEGPTSLWAVTHMDLHRTAKVQAFLTAVKTHFG